MANPGFGLEGLVGNVATPRAGDQVLGGLGFGAQRE